ncbi:MAG TPA: hypothetical protein VN672_07835 [Solirubrobacteraceae bacterium]|nr:hypothetical protein [Solirubrobacteraceae bacterium]
MTSGPHERTPPERGDGAAERTPEPEAETARERFGPLTLLRTRKADGRALLLFSHEEAEV